MSAKKSWSTLPASLSHAPAFKKFVPQWRGPIEGYTVTTLRKSLFKLQGFYEFEDLYQEAYIVYLHCKRRYDHVDNPKWFMALYKRSLATKLIDLAKSKTKSPVSLATENEASISLVDWNSGMLSTVSLPTEIMETLSVLVQATNEFVPSIKAKYARLKLEELLL